MSNEDIPVSKELILGEKINSDYAYIIAVDINGIEKYKEILAKCGQEVAIFKYIDNESQKDTAIIAIKDGSIAKALETTLFQQKPEGLFWGTQVGKEQKMELVESFEKTN